MNKELFKEFVEFCDSQPKDRIIDHDSWGVVCCRGIPIR